MPILAHHEHSNLVAGTDETTFSTASTDLEDREILYVTSPNPYYRSNQRDWFIEPRYVYKNEREEEVEVDIITTPYGMLDEFVDQYEAYYDRCGNPEILRGNERFECLFSIPESTGTELGMMIQASEENLSYMKWLKNKLRRVWTTDEQLEILKNLRYKLWMINPEFAYNYWVDVREMDMIISYAMWELNHHTITAPGPYPMPYPMPYPPMIEDIVEVEYNMDE